MDGSKVRDMTTGKELKLERVAADVGVAELAESMGVSRTTLWTIERAASVRPDHAARVRDALARLQTAKKVA